MKRILIAGIGNVFLGDDGFGVEIAQELLKSHWPPGVQVVDFGIRSYDLAYALVDGYEAAILVDATALGDEPGTIYLIEPDLAQLSGIADAPVDAHNLNPVAALQMAAAIGDLPKRVYLVACEPGELDTPEGRMGLSTIVRAAMPRAIAQIEGLVNHLLGSEPITVSGVAPV